MAAKKKTNKKGEKRAEKKEEKKGEKKPEEPLVPDRTTSVFLDTALQIAREMEVRAIVLYADVFPTREALSDFLARKGDLKTVFVTREGEDMSTCQEKGATVLVAPEVRLTRMGQIKMAVLIGFSRNLFHIGDRLLCLSGVARSGVLDTLYIMEVGKEFELFATEEGEALPAFNPDVFERVLTIATTLAQEGREGRAVGTTFVIGDVDELEPYTQQMIFNPFRGYPEEDRNILDAQMEETLREFSAIDGAFIIRLDGVVMSAGTFLKPSMLSEELPRGLGARHQSAAALTATTNALAITISESTGTVTVFRSGKILIEVERPRAFGALKPRRPSEGVAMHPLIDGGTG